ncbi:MAG TPA: hypothetical protein VGE74_25420 [Gemmata sp.]
MEEHEFLFEKGRASAAQIIECRQEPDGVYFVRNADGNITRHVAAPRPEKHTAGSLQAIGVLANEWAGKCRVWVSEKAVVLKFGDNGEHTAKLELSYSEQIHLLAEWHRHRTAHTQAALISFLRTTLRDTLPSTSLLDAIRKVRFNAQAAHTGEITHGKASIGKELTGEITGSGAIPEYVTFTVPVFVNTCFRHIVAQIECAIEPDAGSGQFRVVPLPNRIIDAGDTGLRAIVEEIETRVPTGTDVLIGTP